MSTPQATSAWTQVERSMRERAYATINDDPQILLEHDSYFTVDADLIYARLIGMEDEIVQDGLRLAKADPVILMPLFPSMTRWLNDIDPVSVYEIEPLRTARYVLQSGYAVMDVDGRYGPPVDTLRFDQTAKVCYLRYRRRL